MAEGENGNFWLGVVVGWVIMVIINLFVPVIGPLAGFFVGGLLVVGVFLYLGILAFIGGAIAGAMRD